MNTKEEGTLSRTPLVDMVDKGDRYHLRLEIPGILQGQNPIECNR